MLGGQPFLTITSENLSNTLTTASSWPFVPILTRFGMALAIGIFIGLEREHSGKNGVRTFALIALLGCLGGLMGDLYAGIAMAFVMMVVVWINLRQMVLYQKLALTTSSALVIVGFSGILCGQGHIFTPVVAGIVTAALLAWKQPISGFALGLSDKELRSAILLAILTFIIFPVLPAHSVDPWGLIEPQSNWASVIIIAAIGFINYILLKIFGPRGMEITAFFGGLINSRKVIVELTSRLRETGPSLLPSVYKGIMLATASMVLRNGLIVIILASQATTHCVVPLTLMLLVSAVLWRRYPVSDSGRTPVLSLESPFKLSAALKFGLVFLALNIVGALAQRHFGPASFYFVSIAGGLLSSASSIASAATLISHHALSVSTGVNGVILSSLTSILINVPLIWNITHEVSFKRKASFALALIAMFGLIGVAINSVIFAQAS
jgi:uncharacterized membrane protein (DUF4010 family)